MPWAISIFKLVPKLPWRPFSVAERARESRNHLQVAGAAFVVENFELFEPFESFESPAG